MQDALSLLSGLNDSDIDWILGSGVRRSIPAHAVLIDEGSIPDAVHFLLEGLVQVRVSGLEDLQPSTLGPGELLGEMSFLEDGPASATVTAAEDSTVLALPRATLSDKLSADPAFASRIYRAFARIIAQRLREREARWRQQVSTEAAATDDQRLRRLDSALADFKELIRSADQAAIANENRVPSDLADDVQTRFGSLLDWVNREFGGDDNSAYQNEALRERLSREFLPFVLLTKVAERAYSKPRGYAGDYLSIDYIYRNEEGGTGRLGPVIDRCFLNLAAAVAVRNRRGLLTKEIRQVIDATRSETTNVTSLACGPAQEVFDMLSDLDDPSTIKVSLVDIDPEALAFVDEKRTALGLQDQMELHLANLIYLAIGKASLDLPLQHFVYSIGLIDYFEDKFVVKLMDYCHRLLKPGGKLILGNFHPRNPSRAFTEHALDWKLIHRTEDDMDRLYTASAFGRPCTRILFEDQRINLFGECVKAEGS
jgi:CRP-like cAMP-binding protein/SAM-dependent methyltransferase